MLRYADYKNMPVRDNGERLVLVRKPVIALQIGTDMQLVCGEKIFVRQGVWERLLQAAALLENEDSSLVLQIAYGYRTLDIQTSLFEEWKKNLSAHYEGDALIEAAHRKVASPDVAGHPTGGAVDVQITKRAEPLDFGTKIWTFVKQSYTFAPDISENARKNRDLLREIMMSVGFAPFDGEWWHFSYGDKEWAKYYSQPFACYAQLSAEIFTKFKNS